MSHVGPASTSYRSTSSGVPFTVLHVCLGNICRSPMAERLLMGRSAARLAAPHPDADPAALLRSVSVGTGDWHVGEPMSQGSAAQLALRGVSTEGFTARPLGQVKLSEPDLILTATRSQRLQIRRAQPGVADRAFSMLQLGRVARGGAPTLPSATGTPISSTIRHRGQALAEAVAALAGSQLAEETDDLTDPYGSSNETYSQVADETDHSLAPLVAVLTGDSPQPERP